MTAFARELRDLTYVHRWGIYRVLHQQNVAEHSYFVAMYAVQLAHDIGWTAKNGSEGVCALFEAALWHDVDEAITGDIVGPVKRHVIDPGRYQGYVRERMMCSFGQTSEYPSLEIKAIIKTADLLDELFYLASELQMGNTTLQAVYEAVQGRLAAAWYRMPAPQYALESRWTVMQDVFYSHRWGCSEVPSNNTDVGEAT